MNRKVKRAAIVIAVVVGVVCGMILVGCYICRRRRLTGMLCYCYILQTTKAMFDYIFAFYDIFFSYGLEETERILITSTNEGQEGDLELPLFDLPTIIDATDGFSFNNKLGEGGFGPVYRVSL